MAMTMTTTTRGLGSLRGARVVYILEMLHIALARSYNDCFLDIY